MDYLVTALRDHPELAIFLTLALLTNALVGQARVRAAEAEQRRRHADTLASQQAALRRVATLVARGADPTDVFDVAVTELARSLGVDQVTLLRFEPDDTCVVLAACEPRATRTPPEVLATMTPTTA